MQALFSSLYGIRTAISEPELLILLGVGLLGVARFAWPRTLAHRANG